MSDLLSPPATGDAAALIERGARRLSCGEVEGYGELLARAHALDDPQRRYWASASLLEQGLAAAARLPSSRAARVLLCDLAVGVVRALGSEPSEPRLLHAGGLVFARLGEPETAAALLAGARRLDPELEAAGELAARATSAPRLARPAAVELDSLGGRARKLAGRAGPAVGLRLSLCMIVRDEQEMLPRCLAAAAEAVDEIVVVDTGSRDATVEIARSFGAQVLEREWSESFAEARNLSFDAAGGDWLMYLDADEVLAREDTALLRSLTGRTWREAFYLTETNHTGEGADRAAVTHDALRVFRNRPHYRFEGRVHEQIAARLPGYLPERLQRTAVRVEHFGYLAPVRRRRGKSARNIALLRREQDESAPSAFLHYNLGAEYAAAGDAAAALEQLERSWMLLKAEQDLDAYEYAPALLALLARVLRACGRAAEAFAQAQEGLGRFPGFTDLVLEQGVASLDLGRPELAAQLFEECLTMGQAPSRYAPRAGAGGQLALLALAEALLVQGERKRAARAILHAREAHAPSGALEALDAWRQLAERAAGVEDASLSEDAVAPLQALLEGRLRARDFTTFELLLALLERTPLSLRDRRELLAETYLRHGYAASAAEEWMAVCAEEPDTRALLGLARVAVARGMTREAEEFACAALALEPENEAAAELCAQAQAGARG